jgi:hypothetical protein
LREPADAELDPHEVLEKIEPPPLRNEAQLNCVSLCSELDDEVIWELSRA